MPLADTTLFHVPTEGDLGELMILMTDIFPTGYVHPSLNFPLPRNPCPPKLTLPTTHSFNAARNAFSGTPPDLWPSMTLAVIGCGPVALCAIICALEYKPARIFAIDSVPSRLEKARGLGCIPVNFKSEDAVKSIREATDGNGVHAVIEGVGLSPALKTAYDIVCPGGKISSFGE